MDIVDFHAHILPRADHGSTSIETSLYQLRSAKDHGVNRIIATPHFYPHHHLLDDFVERRARTYAELNDARDASMPEIRMGAEVLVCEGICRLPGIEKLCINGTNTILLELPFVRLEERHRTMISEVVDLGLDVVLAHADRYDARFISSLLDLNISLQINASALVKLFRSRYITSWLKAGRVVALGSDIHGASPNAYLRFEKAVDKVKPYISVIENKMNEIWQSSKA